MRWAGLIRPGGRVLDLACGHGRHSHALAQLGLNITALDRDPLSLHSVRNAWPIGATPADRLIEADVENLPWPLQNDLFDAIVITNYLWRPLWPTLMNALAPGGVYIHETFAHGQASVGKPSRPEFLLQPAELLQACASLRVVAFEDGFLDSPPRFIQRIAAVRPLSSDDTAPTRFALNPVL
jgi:SAM-dependent methyltransferase